MIRMNRYKILGLAVILQFSSTFSYAACEIPDVHTVPDNPIGPVFKLSRDYPDKPGEERFVPKLDFSEDWKGYLEEVLEYVYSGNVEVDFAVEANTQRKWYHAPWLHKGHSGREYLRGLTRERTSRPKELDPAVEEFFQNWGVGFYNAAAASALGEIWDDFCDPHVPALEKLKFVDGSVMFKLLFTEATPVEIDTLSGSPQWKAHIHTNGAPCDRDRPCPRSEQTVTLLQIDVAVKDQRAGDTGWVFGTFVYDKESIKTEPWSRMSPISIGWGNDPSVEPGKSLAENRIDERFRNVFFGWKERETLGWHGRANGPVDNPNSSCVSCHASAQFPRSDRYANIRPSRLNLTDKEMLRVYFRNIRGGVLFDPDVTPRAPFEAQPVVPVSLDYSLQTQLGLENLCFAWVDGEIPFGVESEKPGICPDRDRSQALVNSAISTMAVPEQENERLRQLLKERLERPRQEPVSKDAPDF